MTVHEQRVSRCIGAGDREAVGLAVVLAVVQPAAGTHRLEARGLANDVEMVAVA